MKYMPEGFVAGERFTLSALEQARTQKKILEARSVLCDSEHNLIVDLGCMKGIIPRLSAAIGIRDGSVRDIAILSRTGKSCCFIVEGFDFRGGERVAILSREKAMREALLYMIENLLPGDIVDAKITHIERFGAFADIGCGNVGLINIENCSVSRITHPSERFYGGQKVKLAVLSVDKELRRFTLSHKELLGTWAENAEGFSVGQTVRGVVRSVMDYGVFVELTPNLSGLAELKSDSLPQRIPDLSPGDAVTVYIKSIITEKMKIKLNIIDFVGIPGEEKYSYKYYLPESGCISQFTYSPPNAERLIMTEFS